MAAKNAPQEEHYENYHCRQRQGGICHRQFPGGGGSRYRHGGRQHQRPAQGGEHHGRAVRRGQRRQHQRADRGRCPHRRPGHRRHQPGRDQPGVLPDRQKAGGGPHHRPCPQHRLSPGRGNAEKGDRPGHGHQPRSGRRPGDRPDPGLPRRLQRGALRPGPHRHDRLPGVGQRHHLRRATACVRRRF